MNSQHLWCSQTNKWNLWYFIGAVTRDERGWKCPLCGKILQRRGAVEMHMRTHTGERPYMCLNCHKKLQREVWSASQSVSIMRRTVAHAHKNYHELWDFHLSRSWLNLVIAKTISGYERLILNNLLKANYWLISQIKELKSISNNVVICC